MGSETLKSPDISRALRKHLDPEIADAFDTADRNNRQLHLFQMQGQTRMLASNCRVERKIIWLKALMIALVALDLLWRAAIAFWGTQG